MDNPQSVDLAPDTRMRDSVIAALRTVYDPEIPINIYDLGLIYAIDVLPGGRVDIRMTLTAPACPVAGKMPHVVEERVMQVPGVDEARVELVWDPPWSRGLLSDAAKLQLGLL
jgi:FeS assembly SUF system protein